MVVSQFACGTMGAQWPLISMRHQRARQASSALLQTLQPQSNFRISFLAIVSSLPPAERLAGQWLGSIKIKGTHRQANRGVTMPAGARCTRAWAGPAQYLARRARNLTWLASGGISAMMKPYIGGKPRGLA